MRFLILLFALTTLVPSVVPRTASHTPSQSETFSHSGSLSNSSSRTPSLSNASQTVSRHSLSLSTTRSRSKESGTQSKSLCGLKASHTQPSPSLTPSPTNTTTRALTLSSSRNATLSTSRSHGHHRGTPSISISQNSASVSASSVASPSKSVSVSVDSVTMSPSQQPSNTRSLTVSDSSTDSRTESLSASRQTLSRSPSKEESPTNSDTATVSSSETLSASITESSTRGSLSASNSTSSTLTISMSNSRSGPTASKSLTQESSLSTSLSTTASGSITASPSPSQGVTVTFATHSPSQSVTPTTTRTITPPPTPSKTSTATASASSTASYSSTHASPTPSGSEKPTETATPRLTVSPTASSTPTQQLSATRTISTSPSNSTSPSLSIRTMTTTNSTTPSMTLSPDVSLSRSPTVSASPSTSLSPSQEQRSKSTTFTDSPTDLASSSPSLSSTPSLTDSPTIGSPTSELSASPTFSASPSPSSSPTLTPSNERTSSVSVSRETSQSESFSASQTPSATPSPTFSPSPSQTLEMSQTVTTTQSFTETNLWSSTVTLSDSGTVTDTDERSLTLTQTEDASTSYSLSTSYTLSSEISSSLASGSTSGSSTETPSKSCSSELTATPTSTFSIEASDSTSDSLSASPTLTASPEPSQSASLTISSSSSASDTDPPSETKSVTRSRSLTPDPSASMSSTDTVTRTMTLTNPSVTMTLSKNLCDDVYFENASDVFFSVEASAAVPLTTLVENPNGNESSVYYQLGRVEFGQLTSGITFTLRLASPLRNMYGVTSSAWSPTPSVSNCKMSNFTIIDIYTIAFSLSYISNEAIGVGTTYVCNVVFQNTAFACPQLLGSVGNRSLLNVSAALQITGGDSGQSFWESLAQTLGTIAGILSGGAALLHQSRASSINSFADCLYSLVDPLSIGDHPLGFGFGPAVGFYLRGAVVGNACFFFIVVTAHSLVVCALTLRSYYVEYYDPMKPPPSVTGVSSSHGKTRGDLHSAMDGKEDANDPGTTENAKKEGKKSRIKLSRAQFPLRHELLYQASVARFPSASVAGAVLTYDGTCTASLGLIMHNVTDYDQALGVLGLIFVTSFVIVQFMLTKTYFRCGSKKLSRKYKDIDTPTEEDSDDDSGFYGTTSGIQRGGGAGSLRIGPGATSSPRKPKTMVGTTSTALSPPLVEVIATDENPDPPPQHKVKPSSSHKKGKEEDIDHPEAPPNARKRFTFWLFSPRMKWLRLDRYPYYKGMFMSLFEEYTIAYFGCAELIVSLVIGTASGVMISERSICNALAGLALTCLFIFILGMIYFNPFINRMDLFHSLAANSFAFLGAILLFIYSRQLQPDESLATAAANLATMVSVLNVIKFLTDIFAKGKQIREFMGIEGRQRFRESKKKHLNVIKRTMTMAARGQKSTAANLFSGASSDGGSADAASQHSGSSRTSSPTHNHRGTTKKGAAARRGLDALSSDEGSFTDGQRYNFDLNSSWAQSSLPPAAMHSVRPKRQHRSGSHGSLGRSTQLSSPISVSARQWALDELGIDTTTAIALPLKDGAAPVAFSQLSDDEDVGATYTAAAASAGRIAAGATRYAPPPVAPPASLEDLQLRIHSLQDEAPPPAATLQHSSGTTKSHFLTLGKHRARAGSGGTPSASMGLMFGNNSSFDAHPAVPPQRSSSTFVPQVTGVDIEHVLAVETDVKKDSIWFGGIMSGDASAPLLSSPAAVGAKAQDRANDDPFEEVAVVGDETRRRQQSYEEQLPRGRSLSTHLLGPTTNNVAPPGTFAAGKEFDDIFDVL